MSTTRDSMTAQVEHLQSKYVGTGHADLNKFEWAVNIQRDSLASYIGHSPMLSYFSVALNESSSRIKYDFLERMLAPCGPPPVEDDEE